MFIEIVCAVALIIFVVLYNKPKKQPFWVEKNIPFLELNDLKEKSENGMFSINLDLKHYYAELKKRGHIHGAVLSFWGPLYIPVDLDLIKNVLVKDFQHFTSHGMSYNREKDPLSAHIFNLDGDEWRDIRVKLTPTFTSGKMKMMFNTLLDCGIPLLEHIDGLCEKNEYLDLKEILASYTTDVIGSCAFGIECNSFKNPNSEFLNAGRRVFAPRSTPKILSILLYYVPSFRKLFSHSSFAKDITDFFTNLIKDIMDHRKANEIKRNDFIHIFLEIQEKARVTGQGGFTLQEIVAQSFVFFLAGFETSSSTMSFCLHELAFNQNIQDKLRSEIKETMEKNDGKLTYDGIMEMKYLDQVINETLRKHPIVPVAMRMCTKDYKVPNTNITIEKGTRTFVSTLGVHYDEEYYPNPEKFDPERFTEENKAKRPTFCFMPFGEGPRICLGMRFGLMQTKTGISMLLNKYKFTPVTGDKYEIDLDPKSFNLAKVGKMEVVPQII